MPPWPCIGQRPERTRAHCIPWTTLHDAQTLATGPVRFTRIACFRCPLPTGKVSQAETDTTAHFARFRCLCRVELGLKVKTK
jgi:hypothetical protein